MECVFSAVKREDSWEWEKKEPAKFALEGIKVLDFTGEIGPYAGKLFVGLGAEVIHLEPIEGDPLRKIGPFYKDNPTKETSLQFLYYNAGKRGIVVDITRQKGKQIFLDLCKGTDVLIESFYPGFLDNLGLFHKELNKINSKLVHTAITPFGSTGPYRDFPTSDMVSAALGGFLYLAGTGNDKPVRAPDNQSFRMADAYAAMSSAIALFHARKTGEGQFLDVSIQECVATALESAGQCYDLEGVCRRGHGQEAGVGSIVPCKDGYVCVATIVGTNRYMWDPFAKWMKEVGAKGAELLEDERWTYPEFRRSEEAIKIFNQVVGGYMKNHRMLSLYEDGQRHRVPITPVSDGKTLWENRHFQERGFWRSVYHESVKDEIVFPGPPYEFGKCGWRVGGAAPTFGQHTQEILEALGYSSQEIKTLNKEGVIYAG